LVLPCRVSELLDVLYAEIRILPYRIPITDRQNFGGVPLGEGPKCWGLGRSAKNEHPSLTNGELKLFGNTSNLCDHDTSTSRTDGQTTCNTALCVASRRK